MKVEWKVRLVLERVQTVWENKEKLVTGISSFSSNLFNLAFFVKVIRPWECAVRNLSALAATCQNKPKRYSVIEIRPKWLNFLIVTSL